MPLINKRSWLAAKIETTAGTPIALSASDATFRVYNAVLNDLTPYTKLEPQGGYGNRKGSHGARMGEATFLLDLRPKSGAHPAWALTFLPACGWVAATNTYTPRTEFVGANVKTLTIAKYTQGATNALVEQLHGAMGNMTFRFVSGEPTMIECRFIGCYTPPTDVANISPTLADTLTPLRFVSSALAVGSYAPRVDSLDFDMGNELVMLPDSIPALTGYKHAWISDRNPTIRISPESELVATQPWWTDFTNHTERAISFALSENNLGASFSFPTCELIDSPKAGERGGLRTDDVLFSANSSVDGADDDGSIVFDIAP